VEAPEQLPSLPPPLNLAQNHLVRSDKAIYIGVSSFSLWSDCSSLFLSHPHACLIRLFNGPLCGSTQMSRYEKAKPIWI